MTGRLNILDFGAVGNSQVKDTHSIQHAINQGVEKGFTVVIPKGIYLVGSLFLKDGSKLHFEEGAILLGSTDLADYPEIYSRVAGVEILWPAAILNAINVNNIEVSGAGIIDGQGPHWWNIYWGIDKNEGLRNYYDKKGLRWIADYLIKRPRSFLLHQTNNIKISDITFVQSGFWNLQITYSDNILVSNVNIHDNHGPSTDGIDIDSSTNVHITRCNIACGDDCIAIKSGRDGDGYRVNKISEHIEIDNCNIRSGYGITLGSEVSGGIRNVYIHDIDFKNSDCGLRMKSSKVRGGFVEDIFIENLQMQNVQFPFSWIMDWHNAYNQKALNNIKELPEVWQSVARQIPEHLQMTKIRNIKINNVNATLDKEYSLPARAFDLVAYSDKPMENICFTQCRIEAIEFGRIIAVNNLKFEDVIISIVKENDDVNNTFDNR